MDKVPVEKVWQIVDWEVKITASWWDLKDFEIYDKMPKELDYVNARLTGNTYWIGITKKNKVDDLWDVKVYYWDAKWWTLKKWDTLTMIVRSKANTVPESWDNILNIACVVKNNETLDCDDAETRPACNSDFNGKTITGTLEKWDYLCNVWKVTTFTTTSTWWTWTCNNKAWTTWCYALKTTTPPTPGSEWEPVIEKTLKNKVIVNAVNQKLTWTVKVTASWWDITDFKVRDKLPKVLKYDTYRIIKNGDNLKLPDEPSGPVESWSYNIYTWNVTWTLHQGKGQELVIEIDSIVEKMPTKNDDYKNIACVEDDDVVDCDIAQPGEAKIIKELQDKREVTETGQKLDWKVTVIASWWDIEDFEIWDKLPVELDFTGWKLDKANTQNWITVEYDDKRSPELSWNVNIHYWNVGWVLYSGNKITMIVKSTVNTMPKAWEDILNVACVVQSGNEISCDKDNPPTPGSKWKPEIKKILTKDKYVTETWQRLEWKVTVKAKWWDVALDKITDKYPKQYVSFDGAKIYTWEWKKQGITIQGFDLDENEWIATWDVTWTLLSWHSIDLWVYTKVHTMPNWVLKNIACVQPMDTEDAECDTGSSYDVRIKKNILDKDWSKVKEITWSVGDKITYIIEFWNNGDESVTVTLKDYLPKSVRFYSGTLIVDWTSTAWYAMGWDFEVRMMYSWSNQTIQGIDVSKYGPITLKPGQSWTLTIEWTILKPSDEKYNKTNFACLFDKDGNKIDCDDAHHEVETKEISCKELTIQKSKLPNRGWSTNVTCSASGWIVDLIEIDCWEWATWNRYIIWSNISSLTGTCNYTRGEKKYNVVCKVTENRKDYTSDKCKWSVRVEGTSPWPGPSPTPPPTTDYCKEEQHKDSVECNLANPHCFNVNVWNFSIESWELLPLYLNVYRESGGYDYVFSNSNDCEGGEVNLASLKCKIRILRPDNNAIAYTSDEFDCLTLGEDRFTSNNNPLIKNRAEKQTDLYEIIPFEGGAWKYRPTIMVTSWDKLEIRNRNGEEILWEYKYQIMLTSYDQCAVDSNWNGEWWKTINLGDNAAVCQNNFVLTDSYTVQKTPSGNLKASTDTLEKFKEVNGRTVKPFSSYLNAISTTEYHPNDKVNQAMDAFIKKYEKLAVSVKKYNKQMKKVPWKNIYFISGDQIIEGGDFNTPFTFVQTNPNSTITIKWNSSLNMMILTKWNIAFEWNCEANQTVKWIFYAQGNLIRNWVEKNNNLNNSVWCTKGWLNVKWVLIWNDFNSLMTKSRSHLETWFKRDGSRDGDDQQLANKVMNWASVVIEYSPSIFTKSTMPPGAEDFTTALSIYKN